MKKILFDGIATQSSTKIRFHGGGEYAKYILKKAIELDYRNFDIVFSQNGIIDTDIKDLVKKQGIKAFFVKNAKGVYALLQQNEYNCFYSPLPYKYKDYKLKILFIMVIHGLRSIELPWDDYRYKYYNKWITRSLAFIISKSNIIKNYLKCRHINLLKFIVNVENKIIITVSTHSKYALLNFYPALLYSQLRVYHSPFEYKEIDQRDQRDQRDKKHYLMINANRYEKNIYRAILAFDGLFSKGFLKNKKVIILGSINLPFTKEVKNKNNFEFLSYVPCDELEVLYKKAFAFVFPSLNEGFGYPPLMAMNNLVPIIASSSTSIPEVCSDAAIYFNPTSIDDLSNRILQIDNNESLRRELITKGITRLRVLKEKQEKELYQMMRIIFD
jgi:glycosyltransferase involved in cell wall biosynthesis